MNEDDYNKYFGIESKPNPNRKDNTVDNLYNKTPPNTKENYNTSDNIKEPSVARQTAEGNIDDIDQFGEVIRCILNAAWGPEWGSFSPELKRGENVEDIILPQITYDTQSREITEGKPIKPVSTEIVYETLDGKKTGDAFKVYRQWFDCIIEFNIWGRTTLEARQKMNEFEGIMSAYTGHLKKLGISEMFFLKELGAKQSYKFVEGIPMRCVIYYIKLERIQYVRVSTLNRISVEIESLNNKGYITGEDKTSLDNIYDNQIIKYDL